MSDAAIIHRLLTGQQVLLGLCNGQVQIAAHHVGNHRHLRGIAQRLGIAGRSLRAQLRALGGTEQAQVPDRFDAGMEVGIDGGGVLHLLGAGRDFRQKLKGESKPDAASKDPPADDGLSDMVKKFAPDSNFLRKQ